MVVDRMYLTHPSCQSTQTHKSLLSPLCPSHGCQDGNEVDTVPFQWAVRSTGLLRILSSSVASNKPDFKALLVLSFCQSKNDHVSLSSAS